MSVSSPSGGAPAAVGGFNFQHRATAWIAVQILAERDATPLWGLPTATIFEWLRAETEQPVDDLLVGTHQKGLVFCQIKRALRCSKAAGSDFASAIDQFVRQFLSCRDRTPGTQLWERPLDPSRDRLVLVIGPSASAPVRLYLPVVLGRIRSQISGESLDNAAINQEERRAFSVVLDHVRRSWHATLGVGPSDPELRQLFSLLHIHMLDADPCGTAEREAKALLRSAVLRNPSDADAVWDALVFFCAELAATRSGVDRIRLQQIVLGYDFKIRAPRSYLEDIERLRDHSVRTVSFLADLSHIQVGNTQVKIRRPSTEELRRIVEEGPIVVVGQPGAGKSGAMHDLAETLQQQARDYVFFAVDHLEAGSLGALRRELGLDHELPEILENWPGLEPAFLLIDALDAARAEPAGNAIRDLIHSALENKRWRVAASIRKFDLRYSQDLKQLFRGESPTSFHDPEFAAIRHVNIPTLSEQELSQVAGQSSDLSAVITRVPKELSEVLFNVRLMAELLGGGVNRGELTPTRTQLELLDLYWKYRVLRTDGQGDSRETVLRRACEEMVKARRLHIDRSCIAEAVSSQSLNDLLSNHVLAEWQPMATAMPDRYVLAFSHHVLFDFAVSRLLFRVESTRVVERLITDPELVLVARPSLHFHFHHLWTEDPADRRRGRFWDLVFRIVSCATIPEIGKLIGPSVAVELARNLIQLDPLCAALEERIDLSVYEAAERALRHIVGSLMVMSESGRPLAGPMAGPWPDFADRVSRPLLALSPSLPLAYSLRTLLTILCEQPESLATEQRRAVGQAARRMLEFAWVLVPRNYWLVVSALKFVCRTFESDPTVSGALIRRALDPVHFQAFGYEELRWLAGEVTRLVAHDATLVEDIYRTAFTYPESSTQTTEMGMSRILALTSTRKQDYDMALYELADKFHEFLSREPVRATRTLVSVLEKYVAFRHASTGREVIEESFEIGAIVARIRVDFSSIWDSGRAYSHDEPLRMLNAFERYLECLSSVQERAPERQIIIEIIAQDNRLAVLWRRLLKLGAKFPETLGKGLCPLAWATPILTCVDTTTTAGEFLKRVFPVLTTEERERVERALLSIPQTEGSNRREANEHIRNRLLGCLDINNLVTDEAQQLLTQLQAAHAVPPNEPLVRLEAGWSKPYGEEEFLADEGVPVQAPPNLRIRELESPVKEFAQQHLNSVPSREKIIEMLPALRALREGLSRADDEGVHPKQRDHAWGNLADACSKITGMDDLSRDEEAGNFARDVLLEASRYPDPEPDFAFASQFDEHPSWGGPAARIDAARGLIVLARHPTYATPEVLDAIERLACDPVPAVRFQIAEYLNALYKTAPETMWGLIEYFCKEEKSHGVLQGLLSGPLGKLSGFHPDRVVNFASRIFDRVRDGAGSKEVRRLCLHIFAGLYIWRGHERCGQMVMEIAGDPAANPDAAHDILHQLRDAMTHGLIQPSIPDQDAVRHRAFGILDLLLESARIHLDRLEAEHKDQAFNIWPEAQRLVAQSLAQLIDGIGRELYFASGAYDNQKSGHEGDERIISAEESKRFYHEAVPLLNRLADVGFPSLAHHLLQTLEFFIPTDPRGVFLRIGKVILAGKKGGYQYESLAADLMVRLVERYLADYRALLREDEECRQMLLAVLDVFVDAGWPSARRLSYRLEEIFR